MVFKSNDNCSHEFLDAGQYQKNGILRYERIFGETFVSTGGETTTRVCKLELNIICTYFQVKYKRIHYRLFINTKFRISDIC